MRKVRVRFAPSPTGALHLGGVRTALYNYLFAKKHGGDFILRIEDTDTARTVPGAEQYILDSLKWCGIEPNEGFGYEGVLNSLYRQSDRKNSGIYAPYVAGLVASGNAYLAFDTATEIDAMKETLKSAGVKTPFAYGVFTRDRMKNSLSLSPDEVSDRLKNNEPYVIRLKMPMGYDIKFKDAVRGDMLVKSHTIDDKVLMKSDGMPTYHLANVVDDHLMDISHVIRGEEWLPSAPLHVYMYECLGWKDTMPEFVHLPLIMGPNGKLSKRDGDKYGFPVYPLKYTDPATGETSNGYREAGYIPDAFVNIVALLGWSPGGNIELMTMDEMIEKFTLEKVGKSGAKFDLKKAEWFNHQYMLKSDNEKLALHWLRTDLDDRTEFTKWCDDFRMKNTMVPIYTTTPGEFPTSRIAHYVENVCGLLKEKVSNINMFWESGKYFFVDPSEDTIPNIDHYQGDMEGFAGVIAGWLMEKTENGISITHDNVKDAFNYAVTSSGVDARDAGRFLRFAITGMKVGPPIFDILPLIGVEASLNRIKKVLTYQTNF
jgi:glutamyl-tRNA synthetase